MELARMEVENLSELMTNLLSTYLSTNSTEQIDKKIKEYQNKLSTLEQKKKDLIRQGMSEEKMNGMNQDLLKNFQIAYKIRREKMGTDKWMEENWISSPKNIIKAKMLGKEPYALLDELREWYEKRNPKRAGKNGNILSIGHS